MTEPSGTKLRLTHEIAASIRFGEKEEVRKALPAAAAGKAISRRIQERDGLRRSRIGEIREQRVALATERHEVGAARTSDDAELLVRAARVERCFVEVDRAKEEFGVAHDLRFARRSSLT